MSKGRWFLAAFEGDCTWGDTIEEGDEIRADGDGGWEHRECYLAYAVEEPVSQDPNDLLFGR